MGKDIMYSMRMDPTLKEKLKKLAKREDRSLANYINFVLKQHVKDKEK
jgi:predicted DNA-binding protein